MHEADQFIAIEHHAGTPGLAAKSIFNVLIERIAVREGVEPGRERATVGQGNAAVLDLPDLDALAVDEVLAVVGLEQQPVTSRHFQLAGLAHVEGGGDAGGNEIYFRAIGTADTPLRSKSA